MLEFMLTYMHCSLYFMIKLNLDHKILSDAPCFLKCSKKVVVYKIQTKMRGGDTSTSLLYLCKFVKMLI
jgi:hypothetical protein